jgi:hypothetical protein
MLHFTYKLFLSSCLFAGVILGSASLLIFNDYLLTRATLPWISSKLDGLSLSAKSIQHDLPGSLTIEDFKLRIDTDILIESRQLTLTYDLAKLLTGELHILSGLVESGHVKVVTAQEKHKKVSSGDSNKEEFSFLVSNTKFKNFDFELFEGSKEKFALHKAVIEIGSYGTQSPFSGKLSSLLSFSSSNFSIKSTKKIDAYISGTVNTLGSPSNLIWKISSAELNCTSSLLPDDRLLVFASDGSMHFSDGQKSTNLEIANITVGDATGPFLRGGGNFSFGEKKTSYDIKLNSFDFASIERIYSPLKYLYQGILSGSLKIADSINSHLSLSGTLQCEECQFNKDSTVIPQIESTFSIEKQDQKVTITNAQTKMQDKESVIADVYFTGSFKLPSGDPQSSLVLDINELDIQKILAALPKTNESEKTLSSATSTEKALIYMPNILLEGKVTGQKIHHPIYSIDKIKSEFQITPQNVTLNALNVITDQGSLDATGLYSANEGLRELHLKGKKLPFITLLANDNKKRGVVRSLRVDLSQKPVENNIDTLSPLSGKMSIHLKDVDLPTRFQDIPPFTIVFLPFQVIEKIAGYVGEALLPEDLLTSSKKVRESLSEQGRVILDDAKAEMILQGEKLIIEDVVFNTDLLPTVDISGEINNFSEVDLVIRVDVAGLLLPLAVTGTLEDPSPSLLNTGPALVKAIGASTVNIATKPFKLLGRIVLGDDDEEDTDDSSEILDTQLKKSEVETLLKSQDSGEH